jgi:hypothetical protein
MTFADFIRDTILPLVNSLTVLLASVALLSFFYGLMRFILNVGNTGEKAVKEGKDLMVWGLVALFVMVSVWGILRFFYSDLGFTSGGAFGIPTFKPL